MSLKNYNNDLVKLSQFMLERDSLLSLDSDVKMKQVFFAQVHLIKQQNDQYFVLFNWIGMIKSGVTEDELAILYGPMWKDDIQQLLQKDLVRKKQVPRSHLEMSIEM